MTSADGFVAWLVFALVLGAIAGFGSLTAHAEIDELRRQLRKLRKALDKDRQSRA